MNRLFSTLALFISTGGQTPCEHGCTEVETELFDRLNEYRNSGNTKIDVIVNYGNNQNHSTNGGTKKYENN